MYEYKCVWMCDWVNVCVCVCIWNVCIYEMYVTSHAGLQICREPKDGGEGEETFRVRITNVSNCLNESGTPYDVVFTAGNSSIRYHQNGSISHSDDSLSITDSYCIDAATFVFFVTSSKQTVNVKGSIIDALLNESIVGYGTWVYKFMHRMLSWKAIFTLILWHFLRFWEIFCFSTNHLQSHSSITWPII